MRRRAILVLTLGWVGSGVAAAEPCAGGEPTAVGNFLGVRFGYLLGEGTEAPGSLAIQALRGRVDCEDPALALVGLELGVGGLSRDSVRPEEGRAGLIAGYELPTLLGHLGVALDAGVGARLSGGGIDWFAFLAPRVVAANLSAGWRLGYDAGRAGFAEFEVRALIPFDGLRPGKFW
jgi:hypothetical protein